MLWRWDRNWRRTCSMHVTGTNIRTNTQIKLLTKKPPITHSASLFCSQQFCYWMYESCVEPGHPHKAFAHHIRSVHWWNENVSCWYTNSSCDGAFIALCAVDSTDCMLACIVGIWCTCWDADNSITLGWYGSAQGRLAQSQSVGQLPLECPGCLYPSVHITCGTSSAWLLAVLRCNAGRSSRTVPGGLPSKRLMSHLSSCASKPSLSLNTRSLPIAPFTMSSNTTKAAISFNGMHCTTLRMLLYPLV